jgi:hypothetical protein
LWDSKWICRVIQKCLKWDIEDHGQLTHCRWFMLKAGLIRMHCILVTIIICAFQSLYVIILSFSLHISSQNHCAVCYKCWFK